MIVMGADGRVQDWNPAAERIFGYSRDEAIGGEVAELIVPGPLRDAHRNAVRRYVETRESTILDRRLELSGLRRDGTELPVELTITRIPDVEPLLFAGFVRDLTRRHVAKRENVRLQQRMAFLAQAGLVLDRSLDYIDTLRSLAELTVPELAQLAVVDLLDQGGLLRTAVAAAPDAEQARSVEAMRHSHPLAMDSTHPVAEVLRSGQPVLLPSMTPHFQREIAQGAEHYELMRRLRYHSAIVVPLVARQRVLGTLSLLRMEGAPPYAEDDLVLAEELARRAALAIDNSRLFELTRHIARTLQESLLPRALPAIPSARIFGRYRAASEGQEVGGDFYDGFGIEENRWGIAIGDVCGKGPEAAALTALARYTIRALAGRDAATVLRLLNDAVIRDHDAVSRRFLTAVFAVASAEGDHLELDVAVGGHPAPLVLRADGTVERVRARGPLIGVTRDVEFVPERLVLSPGDTVVLYTDGLTEARAPAHVLSESDLVALLARGRGLGAERLATFLEQSATDGESPRDDIALLVLELAERTATAADAAPGHSARVDEYKNLVMSTVASADGEPSTAVGGQRP